jgi:hypothetical protein
MSIDLIDVGATANDGSGDPIRSAFQIVNSNFDYINGGLFAGSEASTISAVSVTGGVIVSNTSVTANLTTSNNVVVTGALGGNLFVQSNGAYIIGNVNIIGNLNVSGTQAAAQAQSSTASLLNLHYSATPFVVNDNRDIGLVWQYYGTGPEKKAFLGWQNSTGSLIYWDNITESVGNIITAGTPGNVQIGSLLVANSTAATNYTTGALQVTGGAGIGGNLFVNGQLNSSSSNIGNLAVTGYHVGSLNFAGGDTVYINGSPVQTAANAFNGGSVGLSTTFLDATQSTSATTGAVQIRGGLGVAGNLWVGNIHANIGGNVRANIQGNIFTAAQPFITSLGTLTGLDINGQLNVNDISPNANQTYSLGTSGTDRWLKIWAYDLDATGALTLSGYLNTSGNNQATSTTTGDIRVKGGLSVETGNIFVGGSAGRSITATGNIAILSGNIVTNSDGVANIGSPGFAFNTVHAVATSARYADLAENYVADANYEYGTVVIFGGEREITVTNEFADHRVAGVISQNPAYLMNDGVQGLPVALRGRVPVRVTGPVAKGDLLVTSTTPGYARSVGSDTGFGLRIFAKALESNPNNKTKIIEAVIL